MPDDIKLPPRPEPDGFLTISIIGRDVEVNAYRDSTMDEYARAAVEAERARRVPLTKEQIDLILADGYLAANGSVYSTCVYDLVRDIEAAHGIPAPKGGSDAG